VKLSIELSKWRCDRPDEWKMDEFIRNAEKLEAERDALAVTVNKFSSIRKEWGGLVTNDMRTLTAFIELSNETPQVNLAAHDEEVAAKAVEEFSEFAVNELSKTVVVAYSGCRGTDGGDLSDLSFIETDEFLAVKTEYATQLRAKAKP